MLGEVLGLPAAFSGQRALLARWASSARMAMTAMAVALGRELAPGGGQANRYRETAIWADLSVKTASS